MKSSQVTIKDIARELNISPSTVSRALKDHPDISTETKRLVKLTAEKMNYQPNTLAMGLRQQKSNTIGVIIPQLIHFYFSTVISGIEDIAYSKGYSVIVSQSNESYEREKFNLQELFNHRVDGILMSVAKESESPEHIQALIDRGIPIVFFDRAFDNVPCSRVITDDFQGAYDATAHLVEQGYRRIAHIAGPEGLEISQRRMEGYKKALMDNGLGIDPNLIVFEREGSTEDDAFAITEELLNNRNKPQAIFANNDMAAIGVKSALKSHGLHVPEDMGLVGFSNWRLSMLTEPPLSTVDQPGFKVGQEAARLIIEEIEARDGDFVEPQTIVLPTELIIRESSLNPHREDV